MIVRKMHESDILSVYELEQISFSSPWSVDSLRSQLTNETAVFFVAVEDEKILGYGGMHLVFGEGFVTNIAVFPEHQGKGIGKIITKKLIENCEISISLEVRVSNKAAIKLYENLNFKNMGIRPNFYENPPEDAYIYTLIKE